MAWSIQRRWWTFIFLCNRSMFFFLHLDEINFKNDEKIFFSWISYHKTGTIWKNENHSSEHHWRQIFIDKTWSRLSDEIQVDNGCHFNLSHEFTSEKNLHYQCLKNPNNNNDEKRKWVGHAKLSFVFTISNIKCISIYCALLFIIFHQWYSYWNSFPVNDCFFFSPAICLLSIHCTIFILRWVMEKKNGKSISFLFRTKKKLSLIEQETVNVKMVSNDLQQCTILSLPLAILCIFTSVNS